MKYDPIKYSDDELYYFNKIRDSELELKKYEELSKAEAAESIDDPYISKKTSIKNDIVTYVKGLNQFGVNNLGLSSYDDIQRCDDYLAWYKRINEQEQVKIYNQLFSLKEKIHATENGSKEVSGGQALLANLKRKFLAEVKKLERFDVDTSELTSPQQAIEAFDTPWEPLQTTETLQAWHFSIIGIKASWDLSKYFQAFSEKKVKK